MSWQPDPDLVARAILEGRTVRPAPAARPAPEQIEHLYTLSAGDRLFGDANGIDNAKRFATSLVLEEGEPLVEIDAHDGSRVLVARPGRGDGAVHFHGIDVIRRRHGA